MTIFVVHANGTDVLLVWRPTWLTVEVDRAKATVQKYYWRIRGSIFYKFCKLSLRIFDGRVELSKCRYTVCTQV